MAVRVSRMLGVPRDTDADFPYAGVNRMKFWFDNAAVTRNVYWEIHPDGCDPDHPDRLHFLATNLDLPRGLEHCTRMETGGVRYLPCGRHPIWGTWQFGRETPDCGPPPPPTTSTPPDRPGQLEMFG